MLQQQELAMEQSEAHLHEDGMSDYQKATMVSTN